MKKTAILLSILIISIVFLSGCDVINNLLGNDEVNKIATPIFTPDSGVTYDSPQDISIACATSGVLIFYTLDGTDPTASSSQYTGPFTITESVTIKAFAIKSGMDDSDIATGHYILNLPEAASKIGMLLIGDLGDQGYNDNSYAGLIRAANDFGLETIYDVASGSDFPGELQGLTDNGAELVFGVGWQMSGPIIAAANSNPGTFYVGIDAWNDPDLAPNNALGILFREHESGYLAGIVAGYLTFEYASISTKLNDQNVVGMVMGMDTGPVNRFAAGFYSGVKSVNPDCEILSQISGSFDDWAQGAADAQAMIDLGADIIFNIAGYTGIGSMEAARDAEVLAIGVDVDQNFLYPDTVVTSAIKHVENAVYYAVEEYLSGSLLGGDNLVLGLAEEATGIAPYNSFDSIIPTVVETAVMDAKQDIIDGTISVPTAYGYPANLIGTYPYGGQNDVYLDQDIHIGMWWPDTFNLTSAEAAFTIEPAVANSKYLRYSIFDPDTMLTIELDSLTANTEYTVTFSTDLELGGTALNGAWTWSFTTGTEREFDVPVLTGRPEFPMTEHFPASLSYAISWSSVADAVEYELQETRTGNFDYVDSTVIVNNTTTQITKESSNQYYYRVRGHDGSGGYSEWSLIYYIDPQP